MGRRTKLQGAEQEAHLLVCFCLANAENVKHFRLQALLVNTD